MRALLDSGRPTGLLLCGILHYITDEERPAELVATLCRELPAGSYVFIHHLLPSEDPATAALQSAMQQALGPVRFRTRAEILDLFGGLELIEPGLVLVPQWRPETHTPNERDWPVLRLACAGAARKA